jgi:hypothetical protein
LGIDRDLPLVPSGPNQKLTLSFPAHGGEESEEGPDGPFFHRHFVFTHRFRRRGFSGNLVRTTRVQGVLFITLEIGGEDDILQVNV